MENVTRTEAGKLLISSTNGATYCICQVKKNIQAAKSDFEYWEQVEQAGDGLQCECSKL